MKFQTQWRRDHSKDGEVNTLPSMTRPDESMSIIEIVNRFAKGLPLGGQKNPVYNGEDSGIPDNWDKMDLSEQMAFKEEHLAKIAELQKEREDQINRRGKYATQPAPNEDDQTTEENQQPAPSAGRKNFKNENEDKS